jgi:D-alanine-D-alanine ligase
MNRRRKIRVGVLFGGRSGEHEISLRSALTVISAIDRRRYEVVPIGISREGRWYLEIDALRMLGAAAPRLAALRGTGTPVSLLPYPDRRALVTMAANGRPAPKGRDAAASAVLRGSLDVIFPVLHGTFGEDGTVQGLLELAGIPYVGADVLGSAIGMDKDVQKRLLRDAGLPVVRYLAVRDVEYRDDPGAVRRLAARLGWPVFVKPNALGSSIGVSRVTSARQLSAALEEAFRYDRKVLIEAACEGRELECAVLGNARPAASAVGEIVVHGGHRFYSYQSKYVDQQGAAIEIPARLPARVVKRIRELAVAAFVTLGLRGMARVDFLARPSLDKIYLNEVNTIPGFTTISMYPKLWEASGLPLGKLIDRLIGLALEDHRARRRLKFTYQPRP